MIRSYFKTFNQVLDQGGSRGTTTVIVSYFEDWPPRTNAETGDPALRLGAEHSEETGDPTLWLGSEQSEEIGPDGRF